jgi:hypothetical protein
MDMQKGRKYETETVLELQRGENTRILTRSVVDAACGEGKKSKARTATRRATNGDGSDSRNMREKQLLHHLSNDSGHRKEQLDLSFSHSFVVVIHSFIQKTHKSNLFAIDRLLRTLRSRVTDCVIFWITLHDRIIQ